MNKEDLRNELLGEITNIVSNLLDEKLADDDDLILEAEQKKKKRKNNNYYPLTVSLPKDYIKLIKDHAWEHNMSMSALIRSIVYEKIPNPFNNDGSNAA